MIHIVIQDEMVISPFLTRDNGKFKTCDTLVVENLKGEQKPYSIDFVATNKVNKGWVYLSLHGPQGIPSITQEPVNDIPATVGGGYGIHPEDDGA